MNNSRLSCLLPVILSFTAMFGSCFINAQEPSIFVKAQLIKDNNSKRAKETAVSSRLEGWVYMNYIIGADGIPKDIEVVDRSKKGYSIREAFIYVNNLRFKPATYNEKPVASVNDFLLLHRVSFQGDSNSSISPGFRTRYNNADKLLRGKDVDKTTDALKTLEDSNSKNLMEQSLVAYLYSVFYASQQNWPAYGDRLQTAERLRQYLPTKMAIKNAKNLISYHQFKQHLGEAVYTAYNMANIDNASLDKATLKTMVKPLMAQINSDSPIVVEATLEQDLAWTHIVVREAISLQYSKGKIEQAELRCDNALHPLKLEELATFTIPPDYLKCTLLLKGTSGTEVVLTAQGKGRYF